MGPRRGPAEKSPHGRGFFAGAVGRHCCGGTDDRLQLVRLMTLLPFFQWCENSGAGETIRNSTWLFPVIESFHLLALAVIGGAVLVVDLRLFGFGMRRQPVAQLAQDAQRWLIASLIVMVISGTLLFTSEAIKCYYHV